MMKVMEVVLCMAGVNLVELQSVVLVCLWRVGCFFFGGWVCGIGRIMDMGDTVRTYTNKKGYKCIETKPKPTVGVHSPPTPD